jgi:hypothetical protein
MEWSELQTKTAFLQLDINSNNNGEKVSKEANMELTEKLTNSFQTIKHVLLFWKV